MSSTLLRLGLWIVLIIVALYVLRETFETGPWVEYVSAGLLQKALSLAILVLAGGVVARVLEKGHKVVTKNRCVVCRTPIASGAIYCRAHLRGVLHREEDRTHLTKVRH
jgi:hypothetical protein